MLKFRVLLLAASGAAAFGCRAQAAGIAQRPPLRRPRRRRPPQAPPAPAPAPAAGAAAAPQADADRLAVQRRLHDRSAGEAAARRFRPGRLPGRALLRRSRAGSSVDRAADLPLLHPARDVSLPSQDKWVPYNDDVRADQISARLQAAVGTNFLDDLSVETVDYASRTASSARSWSTTWRSGSGSRSSTTSASKKVEQSKIDEELKKKGIQIRARLVHRPGADPQASPASCATCTPRRATSSPR